MFWDQNLNHFSKFIQIEDLVLITETCGIISRIEPYYKTSFIDSKFYTATMQYFKEYILYGIVMPEYLHLTARVSSSLLHLELFFKLVCD